MLALTIPRAKFELKLSDADIDAVFAIIAVIKFGSVQRMDFVGSVLQCELNEEEERMLLVDESKKSAEERSMESAWKAWKKALQGDWQEWKKTHPHFVLSQTDLKEKELQRAGASAERPSKHWAEQRGGGLKELDESDVERSPAAIKIRLPLHPRTPQSEKQSPSGL